MQERYCDEEMIPTTLPAAVTLLTFSENVGAKARTSLNGSLGLMMVPVLAVFTNSYLL